MLYPCFVAKLVVRFQKWNRPRIEKKNRIHYFKYILKTVFKDIRTKSLRGETATYTLGESGEVVKYIVPRIQKSGYDVTIFNLDNIPISLPEVEASQTYSFAVSWFDKE